MSLELTNEELKVYVNSLIDLHHLMKQRRAEIKKYNETYKRLAERVKDHATKHKLKYIDSRFH